MKIAILNACNPKHPELELDEYMDYRDGRDKCFSETKIIKKCTSWHSWARALETEFFVLNKSKWPGVHQYDGVIVLVHRDFSAVQPIVHQLKKQGKKVFIAYHEGTANFISPYDPTVPGTNLFSTNHSFAKLSGLQDLVSISDGYLNFIGHSTSFWEGVLNKPVHFINHCWPFDWEGRKQWIVPWNGRRDILIGTRTFSQFIQRNSMIAVGVCAKLLKHKPKLRIDMVCEDKLTSNDLKILTKMGIGIGSAGGLEYNDWLKLLGQYKFIVHFDTSLNYGQIAGDGMMVDTWTLGSTTDTAYSSDSHDYAFADELYATILLNLEACDTGSKYQSWDPRWQFHPDKIKEDIYKAFATL